MQNRMVVLLCNLKPAKMRGIVSEAMVMCASTPDKVGSLPCLILFSRVVSTEIFITFRSRFWHHQKEPFLVIWSLWRAMKAHRTRSLNRPIRKLLAFLSKLPLTWKLMMIASPLTRYQYFFEKIRNKNPKKSRKMEKIRRFYVAIFLPLI